MGKIPTISEYMTVSPHTIGEDIILSKAIHQMREFGIRHLPVLRAGELVGVISDRDVKLALSIHANAGDLKIGDVMSDNVYWVTPETPVDKVTETMFREKFGCTVIRRHDGKTVGIFAANDALKVLTILLRAETIAKAFVGDKKGPSKVEGRNRVP